LGEGGNATWFGVTDYLIPAGTAHVPAVSEGGSIPGTGISYIETSTVFCKAPARRKVPAWSWLLIIVVVGLVMIAA